MNLVMLYKFLIGIFIVLSVYIIFNFIYAALLYIQEKLLDNKINTGMNTLNINDIKKDIENKQYVSKKKKSQYIYRLGRLIQQSAISEKFKFVTPGFLIFISVCSAVLAFFISQKFIGILVPSLMITVVGYKIPVIVLNVLVAANSNKFTKKLIDFINLLKNFCMIDNNISLALIKSVNYMKEPIKPICEDFAQEVQHGMTSYDALEHIKYRLNSKQYELLIKNLQICSEHSNDYLNVLDKSLKLVMEYSKKQVARIKEMLRGIRGVSSLLIAVIIVWALLLNINTDLLSLLKTSFVGNVIVSMFCFDFIAATFIIEKLARFDF